jgi:hypothetical protein
MKAFLVGCVMSLAQQLTGINAVVFYSNAIFAGEGGGPDADKKARMGTIIFGVVNMVSALSSVIWLKFFGRKTLLVFG